MCKNSRNQSLKFPVILLIIYYCQFQLMYSRFFSGKSASDACTMFSDKSIINRRNVSAEVKSAYRADRDFFQLLWKSRVIAAAMNVLGFDDKNALPTKVNLPLEMKQFSKAEKLKLLHELSAKVVDTFVFKNGSSVQSLVESVLTQQEREAMLNQDLTPDGRFPCRFHGCKRSFKYNGLSRRNHELSHDPPVEVDQQVTLTPTKPSPSEEKKTNDDVFSYNTALLTDGFLFMNFLDAIKEGDGTRLMRQYKYFMLYCKADGVHSTKYALECLYQMFLVQATLSERDTTRFIWNRSVNNHGKAGMNIPLDEATEHSNNFVKQAIKNLGPNLTERAISRICNAERSTKCILTNLDETIKRGSKSGKPRDLPRETWKF